MSYFRSYCEQVNCNYQGEHAHKEKQMEDKTFKALERRIEIQNNTIAAICEQFEGLRDRVDTLERISPTINRKEFIAKIKADLGEAPSKEPPVCRKDEVLMRLDSMLARAITIESREDLEKWALAKGWGK